MRFLKSLERHVCLKISRGKSVQCSFIRSYSQFIQTESQSSLPQHIDPLFASHPSDSTIPSETEREVKTHHLHPDSLIIGSKSQRKKQDLLKKVESVTLADFRNSMINDPRKALIQFRGLMERKEYLSYSDYALLLTHFYQIPEPTKAEAHVLEVLEHMRNAGWPLDQRIYHTLFGITLRSESTVMFHRWIHEMIQVDKLQPDIKTLNLWMQFHAQRKDLDNVIQTWEFCINQYPEAEYFNTDGQAILVESYSRNGQHDKALELHTTFTSRFGKDRSRIPSVLHEVYIRVLGLSGAYKDAMQYLYSLEQSNLVDLHIYDAALEACHVADDLKGAYRVWKSINRFCKQEDRSIKTYTQMRFSRNFNPKKPTELDLGKTAPLPPSYQRLIEMEAARDNFGKVVELYEEHVHRQLFTKSTLETVLKTSLYFGDVQQARQVVSYMKDRYLNIPAHWVELFQSFGLEIRELTFDNRVKQHKNRF